MSQIRFKPLSLGPLPIVHVEKHLNLIIAEGSVHFSIPAQNHAYRNHGDDFMRCMPYLSQAIADPHYIGQAPHYKNKGFEVIFSPPAEEFHMLIAVQLRCDNRGRYQLSSVYPVDTNKINGRIRKGFLKKITPA